MSDFSCTQENETLPKENNEDIKNYATRCYSCFGSGETRDESKNSETYLLGLRISILNCRPCVL